MLNGNGSSSRSTQQLVTRAAGYLKSLPSRGTGGGDMPLRHPGCMKSVHELDGAGRGIKRPSNPTVVGGDEYKRFQCSFCESFFISQKDLQCHIRCCHVPRSWRRGREEVPGPPPSVTGSNPSISIPTGKKGPSVLSKQQPLPQLADEAAPAEAPAMPTEPFPFDLNVPVPEEEEKRSSGRLAI